MALNMKQCSTMTHITKVPNHRVPANLRSSRPVIRLNALQTPSAYSQMSSEDGISISLYASFKPLPPDGQTIPQKDEMCDPNVSKCKTPTYVYEAVCKACFGTGSVRARSNGRRGAFSTCPCCLGIGYTRHSTTRFAPDVTEDGPHITANRPKEA